LSKFQIEWQRSNIFVNDFYNWKFCNSNEIIVDDLNSEDKKKIRETPWDIVVHHGECPDGVTAAWIVLRKWDWKPKYYGSEPWGCTLSSLGRYERYK